jgi:DNA invertase Pin-like site-specific DNA recombinase
MKRVFGYCRVSTKEQGLGYSPDTQVAAIGEAFISRGYAARGYAYGGVLTDIGVSGGKPMISRPNGQKLLAGLLSGDVVLLTKLDRGFRNTADFLETCRLLTTRGVTITFLDNGMDWDLNNPVAVAMVTILAVFAEFEREMIRSRIKAGFAHMKKHGLASGKAPYGYRKSKLGSGRSKLVVNQDEVDIIADAIDLMASGTTSRQVAKLFNEQGRLIRGTAWRDGVHVRIVIKIARRGVLKKLKEDKDAEQLS